jgi:predicted small metal-binding protein
MRVLECNTCGEPLTAANDEELLKRLRQHMESEHPSTGFDETRAREMIANEAYNATDN